MARCLLWHFYASISIGCGVLMTKMMQELFVGKMLCLPSYDITHLEADQRVCAEKMHKHLKFSVRSRRSSFCHIRHKMWMKRLVAGCTFRFSGLFSFSSVGLIWSVYTL